MAYVTSHACQKTFEVPVLAGKFDCSQDDVACAIDDQDVKGTQTIKMHLTVSPLPVFTTRESAKRWLLGIRGLSEHAGKFKLGEVISTKNNTTLFVDFLDVQLEDLEELILQVSRTVARVHFFGDFRVKAQPKRERKIGVDRRRWHKAQRRENAPQKRKLVLELEK